MSLHLKGQSVRVSVAITGASGAVYGLRMLEVLAQLGHQIELVISDSGLKCLHLECGVPENRADFLARFSDARDRILLHDAKNIASSLASGSALRDLHAGFIVPCSMGTAARIAAGISGNLIERHADVLIKERKPLVLIPRETPLSTIHLENLLKLTRAGCICLPAMPGFYHQPKTSQDLIDHVIGKALDAIGIEHELYERWKAKG